MLCSVRGTSGTLMGAVLCIITKSVTYRTGCVHATLCSGCKPAVNKPRLPISSLDIIIKLKLCWQCPKY